ncbi:MAG TPA: branched-chain amino acid transaminase [Ktedonobacterales bacterium]|nr:branched-chain amino acid transaminase [Ktedonobacterales bacterium]
MTNLAALSQQHDATVFLNGKYVAGDEARVGVMTHGFSYGTGVFEGIRGYWNAEREEVFIFRAREHFERMHRSCKIMHMRLPYSVDELIEIAVQLVRRNDFHENVYIRPFAYKADEAIGVKLHGVEDHFTMYCVPMGDYISTTGLRCGVSSWRRLDDNMIPVRAKVSGGYVNSALAKSEAMMNGFDEAILLTSDEHVSEGSAENLFMVCNGELVTPSATDNILLGITRDTVIQVARRELDRITREKVLARTELYTADEIFLTGTGAQIAPVVEVDHRPIGTGAIGPITTEVMRLYGEIVRGRRAEYMEWCLPVWGPVRAASNANPNGHKNGHAAPRPRATRPAASRP